MNLKKENTNEERLSYGSVRTERERERERRHSLALVLSRSSMAIGKSMSAEKKNESVCEVQVFLLVGV